MTLQKAFNKNPLHSRMILKVCQRTKIETALLAWTIQAETVQLLMRLAAALTAIETHFLPMRKDFHGLRPPKRAFVNLRVAVRRQTAHFYFGK